eukprot:743334-Prorocentrum_lima.AAC.1
MEGLQCLAKNIMIQLVKTALFIHDLVQERCRGQGCDHVLLGCRGLADAGDEDAFLFLLRVLLFFAC